MSSNFVDQFTSKDFNPEKYVNDLSSQSVGGNELSSHKQRLQALSEETNASLKKNVYQHYEQFISTAKDISYLAGEMYQISQTLRDQRSLIQLILDSSIISTANRKNIQGVETPTAETDSAKPKANEDEARKKILGLLEKVEGAGEIIEEEDRVLIYEGDLLEIDPDSYSAVQRKRGYLFNDGIMLAVWVPNRRGPQRYKFQAFYELGSIGLVVNIRDPECPKHTFKLLIFPSVHLLQCPNQQEKESWVTQIETMQKILRNPPKTELAKTTSNTLVESPISEYPPAGGFPSMDSERAKSPDESMGLVSLNIFPEWVMDIPEDLDVWIAQRNFMEAVDLYESFKEFLETQPMSTPLKDIKSKVEIRIRGLIDTLVADLEIMTPEKLQGGPRSIRKSVDLLIRLGRENQASQLFLVHRSAFIKQRLKRLKQEGRSHLYIDQMTLIFFTNILETIGEYKMSFSANVSGMACLVVWVNSEVNNFVNTFCRQLFTPQSHLSSVSDSVAKLREENLKLKELGLDVSSVVDSLLMPHIERTVGDAKEKLIEAVKHRYRNLEDLGINMKFTDETMLNKTVQELMDLGVKRMQNFVQSESSLNISGNTVSFAKSWLHFCRDAAFLGNPEWQLLLDTAICEVILMELKYLDNALSKATKRRETKIILVIERDCLFILDFVCKAANQLYSKVMKYDLSELTMIIEQYSHLKHKGRGGSPIEGGRGRVERSSSPKTNRSYTSTEYV